MNRIYLNDTSKKYYTDCLIEEIERQNIDQGIVDKLLIINRSQGVRTVFSKRGQHDIKKKELHSYLRIAFTKDVEEKLLNEIVPFLNSNFNSDIKFNFNFRELKPTLQDRREINEHNKGSKWLVDPEYFNISHLLFEIKKGDREIHANFWDKLSAQLSSL